jgi:hypothetical protein
MGSFMKMAHRGEKGFTLIELLIVVATANTEAENVKTASMDYFADYGIWPIDSNNLTTNSTYIAGTLKASYHFNNNGFIDGVGNPGATPVANGTTSTGYSGIHWLNPAAPGHGKWVKD